MTASIGSSPNCNSAISRQANATRTLSLSNKSPEAFSLSPLNIYHNIQLQKVKISKVSSQDSFLSPYLTSQQPRRLGRRRRIRRPLSPPPTASNHQQRRHQNRNILPLQRRRQKSQDHPPNTHHYRQRARQPARRRAQGLGQVRAREGLNSHHSPEHHRNIGKLK
jgi:hypothetical protein